jgi:hypothetical protein
MSLARTGRSANGVFRRSANGVFGSVGKCPCGSAGTSFLSGKFLVTLSGITIPTGVCFFNPTQASVTVFVGSTSLNAGESQCLPYDATKSAFLLPGQCVFDVHASGSPHTYNCTGSIVNTVQWFLETTWTLGSGTIIQGFSIGLESGGVGIGVTVFDSGISQPTIACGGSATIANTAQWRPSGGGAATSFGGSVTITDMSC